MPLVLALPKHHLRQDRRQCIALLNGVLISGLEDLLGWRELGVGIEARTLAWVCAPRAFQLTEALPILLSSLNHRRGELLELLPTSAARVSEEPEHCGELAEVDLKRRRRQEQHRLESPGEDLLQVLVPLRRWVLELVRLVEDQKVVTRETRPDEVASRRSQGRVELVAPSAR